MSLVVVYHLLPKAVTGGYVGVDVFFVISGFLITSHLLSKPPTNLRLLGQFWARRIRRLLPAAFVVILGTLAMTWALVPESRWRSISWDAIASAFYFQNWRLATGSTDYLGAEEAASPLQHFWSLSVEEQFYVFWPLLILLVMALAAHFGWKRRASVTGAILVVVAASFAFGLYYTHAEPAAAYFVTTTRMWELGIGAALACVGPLLRPGRSTAILVAWAGLALILWSATAYTPDTSFPGAAALAPTLGAALVIWAASESRWSPTGWLRLRPVQWLGDASYSIYLWHWPFVALIPFVGNGRTGWVDSVLIVVATLVLSALTKVYVEDRFRTARLLGKSPRSFALAAGSMGLVAALALVPIAMVAQQAETSMARAAEARTSTDACTGARALDLPASACPTATRDQLVPEPAVAGDDKSDIYADGCLEHSPYEGLSRCVYGTGSRDVAIVGNSHAAQWVPALREIAKKHDLRITTFTAASCAPIDANLDFTPERSKACRAWGERAVKATSGDQFDLVIATTRNVHGVAGSTKKTFQSGLERGYEGLLKEWLAEKTNLLVLHDTPFPQDTIKSIPDCLANPRKDIADCSGSRGAWVPEDPLYAAAKKLGHGIDTADLNDHFCREDRCYGANGGVVTYFDGSHVSATYAATLAPYLAPKVLEALDG